MSAPNAGFTLPNDQREQYLHFLSKTIPAALSKIKFETKPHWGKMTAQHMVEHLQSSMITSTIVTEKTPLPPNKMQTDARNSLLYSPSEMPRNVQNPAFQFGLPAYSNANIDEAKVKLQKSIESFMKVRESKPNGIAFNTFLGDLNFDEQLIFHYKHFKHHFSQFGLL